MGDARQVMDQATEAINRHDVDALAELYADDAIVVDPFGETRGRDAVREFWRGFFEAFPDMNGVAERKHESGSTAIDEWTFSGTHTGPMPTPTGETVPATGRRVEIRGADFATVENGKIVDHRVYFDQMQLLGQLGLVPEGAASA